MLRHFSVGLVDEGLEEIGGGDAAFEDVRDQEDGTASQELAKQRTWEPIQQDNSSLDVASAKT